MYLGEPSNSNNAIFVVQVLVVNVAMLVQHTDMSPFPIKSKVPHNGGGSHVDKATWDGCSHVMSSNEGGTSFTSKFLLTLAPNPKVMC